MYDFKGFGSTPRSAIPELREYSHKSGIVPLGVLPDPLKLCTGSGHDMIYKSVIILPLDTMGALPETKNKHTGSTPRYKKYDYWEYYNIYYIYFIRITPGNCSGNTLLLYRCILSGYLGILAYW